MKQKIIKIFTSKLPWAFLFGHWILYTLAIYERGGLNQQFHFYYEPLLFQIILLMDFFWLSLADKIDSGSIEAPGNGLLLTGILAGIQWFVIGGILSRLQSTPMKAAHDTDTRKSGS